MADRKLAKICALSREVWEAMNIPDSKKTALRRAIKYGAGKLGADEYSSGEETRFVPRTCKSHACAECGANELSSGFISSCAPSPTSSGWGSP